MTQPSAVPKFQRWYDKQPKLSRAVNLLMLMPDEIRTIISESLIFIANREFDEVERRKSFRTLGSEKIMGLHQAQKKRREYDKNVLLRRMMGYLYILSDENQAFMADHILYLVQYVQDYLKTCQEFENDPTLEDVAKISHMYVSTGSASVKNFLRSLREHFSLNFSADGSVLLHQTLTPRLNLEDIIKGEAKEDKAGMKITQRDL